MTQMLKTLQESPPIAKPQESHRFMVFFAFEQPNAVKGTKSIQIGEISQEKSVDFKQSRSLTGSLKNAITPIAIKERITNSEP